MKNLLRDVDLAPYTSWKIGGSAQYLTKVKEEKDLIKAIRWAREEQLPVTILGSGSNTLVSDKGVRGLVILNQITGWQKIEGQAKEERKELHFKSRLDQIRGKVKFADLFYDESDASRVKVRVQSGTNLEVLIRQLLEKGITGLHWFAGIPGTVGGGVYNNIHCGHMFIGQFIDKVRILDKELKIKPIAVDECQFDYDASRFQGSGEIILSVDFNLFLGDVEKAKEFIQTWTDYRTKRYPWPSAGCVFKNIDEKTQQRLGFPTPSWGYIIDKVLGLKGKQIGGAKISEKHSAFIVNETGRAKAKDILALIELIKKESKEKLGIEPELEIFLLGEF